MLKSGKKNGKNRIKLSQIDVTHVLDINLKTKITWHILPVNVQLKLIFEFKLIDNFLFYAVTPVMVSWFEVFV